MAYAAMAARGTGRKEIRSGDKLVIRGGAQDYAQVYRSTVAFHGSQLGDVTKIDIKTVAKDLKASKLDNKIKFVNFNGRTIKITLVREYKKRSSYNNGIKFGSQLVNVRDPAIRIWSVTMVNVLSDYTNKELAEHVMKNFGSLHNVYDSISGGQTAAKDHRSRWDKNNRLISFSLIFPKL